MKLGRPGFVRNIPPVIRSVFEFLRGLRCKPLLLLTLLCLSIREQFPFSNFPMYSSFTNKTFYVHLADGTGQPVSTIASAAMHTSKLKKIYQNEVLKEMKRLGNPRTKLTTEQKRSAGERVLATLKDSQWVRQDRSRFPQVARLYEVTIALSGGRFEKQSLLIAETR